MGDNLRIGATVDVGAINEGMANVQEITRSASDGIAISFEECSAKTKSAMRNLSDDVKQAADSVSKESLRVAEATRTQAEAFADLRRATVLTKDSSIDAALAAKLLAAAQEKAAAATAEKAAAQRAAAEAAARAAEEEELSANAVARAFQRAAREVRESLSEMQEKFVETAETAKLSGEGMASGFSALSGLLGAGIFVDFFAHFLDETAHADIELSHLHEKTGILVTDLAGLKQITKESGAEFEAISTGLVRMVRSQQLAKEGNEGMIKAFERLGISVEQVKSSSPEQLLQILATRFAETENSGKLAATAIQLFGKGGAALIPILKQQGDHLTENVRKTGELTGVTDQSVAAAERWQKNVAILSRELQKFGNLAIENMHYVVGGFDAIGATFQTVFEGIATALLSVARATFDVGRLLADAFSGNYGALLSDAAKVKDHFVDTWKAGMGDISNAWHEVATHFKTEAPPPIPHLGGGEDEGDEGTGKSKKGRDTAFVRDEEELNEKRLAAARAGNEFLLVEEVRFWEGKLAAAKKGSDEYRSILAKLAPLEERLNKQKANPEIQLEKPDITKQVDAFIAANNQLIKANEQAQKQNLDAFRSSREEEIRIQEEKYRDLEQDTQFEVRMGQITADERLEILRQAADQEYEIRLSALHAIEAVDKDNVAKYQQDLNRELEITRQHNRQIVQLDQQTALNAQHVWQDAYEKMTSEFNRNVAQWVTTQRGFAQSMAQMMNGITQNFIQNVLKMTEQFLVGLLIQKAGQKNQIYADAKTAAANTYAAVSAIPIVGPFLAPPAAAAAFAGVLAFESFNEGGVVQQGNGYHVPILAKQGERVLTPTQNQNFESLVNNSNSNTSRGGDQFHLHYNGQVNAFDRQGFRSTLRAHADDLADIIRDQINSGRLRA